MFLKDNIYLFLMQKYAHSVKNHKVVLALSVLRCKIIMKYTMTKQSIIYEEHSI